jgi:hypothetical protein
MIAIILWNFLPFIPECSQKGFANNLAVIPPYHFEFFMLTFLAFSVLFSHMHKTWK